jgi:hypothetical protein
MPRTCDHQTTRRLADGTEIVLCDLPPGGCVAQGAVEDGRRVCTHPHCVFVDWQIVQLDDGPARAAVCRGR